MLLISHKPSSVLQRNPSSPYWRLNTEIPISLSPALFHIPGISGKPMAEVGETRGGMQLSFFQLDDPILCQIRDEILNLDVNNLTPLEALNKLNDIKRIVKGK